jgi:tRNA G10  N-methylase Trm11
MNSIYVFHLGREKNLSLAEIKAFFQKEPTQYGEIALLPIKLDDPQAALNHLGGTLKISRVIETSIPKTILTAKPEGKIKFGLNVLPESRNFLRQELKKIKAELKHSGRNSRFINKESNLTTAMISKGGLMKDLTDFNLIKLPEGQLTSQTVAVQDFVSYSLRDYEKPVRLAREGMLPPKLSQIMINLSGVQSGTLYDPFCGSGTVLGEALIKGYDVIGSDLDPKAIDASEKNSIWIKQKFNASGEINLFEKDAQELTAKDFPKKPDLVVAETFLGPPCHLKMTFGQIKQIQEKLMPLYEKTFQNLHPLLANGTPLVIAFPLHHVNRSPHPLELEKMLTNLGYEVKKSFTYHRQKQVVGRHIMVYHKS